MTPEAAVSLLALGRHKRAEGLLTTAEKQAEAPAPARCHVPVGAGVTGAVTGEGCEKDKENQSCHGCHGCHGSKCGRKGKGIVANDPLPPPDPEERAAIAEYAGGVPAIYATAWGELQASPALWADPVKWQATMDAAGLMLDHWGAEAARLGWTAEDLFGRHPTHPEARHDAKGLALLLGAGDVVVAMTGEAATIRLASGAVQVFRRIGRGGG